MRVARTATELGLALAAERPKTVGFVATMGALHEGHLSLVRRARLVTDVVVMSIFVNPLQFGPGEDFASYPRDEQRDLALAASEGVDYVFVPSVHEMYPDEPAAKVTISGAVATTLEGEARPGHFDGVATIVTKLFNVVDPVVAFFGQKDAQQVAVVKRTVSDLSFAVEIVVCPTVREPDGLAVSSRNAYLDPLERARATVLYRALLAGVDALQESPDYERAEKEMWELLATAEGVTPGYAAVVDPETFEVPRPGRDLLLAVAATVGKTRLIDNILVEPSKLKERG